MYGPRRFLTSREDARLNRPRKPSSCLSSLGTRVCFADILVPASQGRKQKLNSPGKFFDARQGRLAYPGHSGLLYRHPRARVAGS